MGTALAGRTIVMSGGSRGIGLAILVAAAREGANAVILAKTDEPDPRLPGTVHTAVAEIEAAGGRAVGVIGDVRVEEDVQRAVDAAVSTFGGVDICVNNASALNLVGTEDLPMKRFDLMQQINTRGTFLLTKTCAPHLRRRARADPDALAAAQPGPEVAGPVPRLHAVQVRHVAADPGLRRRVRRVRGDRELPVAAHHDRDGRGDQPDPRGGRELAVGGHHG